MEAIAPQRSLPVRRADITSGEGVDNGPLPVGAVLGYGITLLRPWGVVGGDGDRGVDVWEEDDRVDRRERETAVSFSDCARFLWYQFLIGRDLLPELSDYGEI